MPDPAELPVEPPPSVQARGSPPPTATASNSSDANAVLDTPRMPAPFNRLPRRNCPKDVQNFLENVPNAEIWLAVVSDSLDNLRGKFNDKAVFINNVLDSIDETEGSTTYDALRDYFTEKSIQIDSTVSQTSASFEGPSVSDVCAQLESTLANNSGSISYSESLEATLHDLVSIVDTPKPPKKPKGIRRILTMVDKAVHPSNHADPQSRK